MFNFSGLDHARSDDITASLVRAVEPHASQTGTEFECRLGRILQNKRRIVIPILTPAIVAHEKGTNFEASVPLEVFSVIQEALMANPNLECTSKADLTDYIYNDGKRLTLDNVTKKLVNEVLKEKHARVDLHCPKDAFDIRFAVAVEQESATDSIPTSIPGNYATTRRKERASFHFGDVVVDMTSATLTRNPNAPPLVTHEVELEVSRAAFQRYREEAEKDSSTSRARLTEMCEGVLGAARYLQQLASSSDEPNAKRLKQ